MFLIISIVILDEILYVNSNYYSEYDFDPLGPFFGNDIEIERTKKKKAHKLRLPDNFDKWDLTLSVFPSLENYQVAADETDELDYPWIARVVHSPHHDYPVICTASCIDKFIFITAARCLFSLRVVYTRVFYNGCSFQAKAFVTPTHTTKQSFDDIGFIVVLNNNTYSGKWPKIGLYDQRRTDNGFSWFAEYLKERGRNDHMAIGWTVEKRDHKIKKPKTKYILTELDVVLGLDLCAEVYTVNFKIKGFYVPCYFGCDLNEFKVNSSKCERAHGAEGGAILDVKGNILVGVATWGAFYPRRELPLGFSVVNSDNFYKDRDCAYKIRNDARKNPPLHYLQSLCPN